MLRLLLLLLLALPLSGRAATISSATCPGTGCITTYLGNLPATAVSVQVTGTWVGTLVFEGSNDGSTYRSLLGQVTDNPDVYTLSTTANGRWLVQALGALYVRVRADSWTSGSATVLPQPTSSPPLQRAVSVDTPDGGLSVTLGTQRVSVEATGPGGDPVTITGSTVTTLAPSTITALGPDTCMVYPRTWQDISPAAASAVPPNLPDGGSGGLEGRTHLLLVNTDDINSIACSPMQSDGGLPEWGIIGTPLFKNGGSNMWPIKSNVVIYCRAKAGSVVKVSPEELICAKVP